MFQLIINFIATAPQCQFIRIRFVIIVSIQSCHLTESSVTLHTHKIFKSIHSSGNGYAHLSGSFIIRHRLCIDFEHGLIRILQFPDKHQSYQNGVTNLIIHLDRFYIQITGTQRELFLIHKRIHPKETGFGKGTLVLSEEYHSPGFVRFLRKISGNHQNSCRKKEDQQQEQNNTSFKKDKAHHNQKRQYRQINKQGYKPINNHVIVLKFFCIHRTKF